MSILNVDLGMFCERNGISIGWFHDLGRKPGGADILARYQAETPLEQQCREAFSCWVVAARLTGCRRNHTVVPRSIITVLHDGVEVRVMSTRTAARRLGLSKWTLYNWGDDGPIKPIHLSGWLRLAWRESDVEKFNTAGVVAILPRTAASDYPYEPRASMVDTLAFLDRHQYSLVWWYVTRKQPGGATALEQYQRDVPETQQNRVLLGQWLVRAGLRKHITHTTKKRQSLRKKEVDLG